MLEELEPREGSLVQKNQRKAKPLKIVSSFYNDTKESGEGKTKLSQKI